ncbi:MAG TPA: Gfo/Idh/MocA family oxidoreductase [Puia sp.]|nr:Gfo/Idh/MocA family oxidoreductase [Puia sp.]
MKQRICWGILGCGRIARKFAADLKYAENAALIAVGSRSRETAQEFVRDFPVRHMHDSYEALAANPEVDIIYIASPHGLHYEHTMLCLEHKKAVLCEKAFALNSRQAKEMIATAQSKGVFLMEALWTKFMPHYNLVLQLINDGRLGEIQNMLVNFGFIPAPPIPQRLFDPSLGGGSLLDIGIYNVFMAMSVLGKPDIIESSMTPATTGVDEQCAVLFKYQNGAMAQLFASFSSNLATEADISGNKARIRLTSRFYEPGTTIEFYPGRVDTRQIIPFHKEPGFGYQFEARHAGDCLRMGMTESPIMSHQDTLLLMETLDRIRAAAGIRYAVD